MWTAGNAFATDSSNPAMDYDSYTLQSICKVGEYLHNATMTESAKITTCGGWLASEHSAEPNRLQKSLEA